MESVFINQSREIHKISINDLKYLQGDLKSFSDSAYQKLKSRILEVGFKYAFYYWQDSDGTKYIMDGHHRKKALLKMQDEGISIPEYYPAIQIEAKSKKEAAKELLQLNSNYGKMTFEGLKGFFKKFEITPIEIKNIEINPLNIDAVKIADQMDAELNPTYGDDDITDGATAITKPGDLWELNNHRLLCGDSTDIENIKILMNGKKSNMVVTSPPYWVGKDYEKENSEIEIDDFIEKIIVGMVFATKKDYSRIIINTGVSRATSLNTEKKPRVILLLDKWINNLYKNDWYLRHIRHWIKGGGSNRPRTPAQDIVYNGIEYLLTFYNVSGNIRGQNRISESWVQQSNWIDIPGDKQENKAGYPVELPRRCIILYAKENDIIFDPFLGNGTTIIAAQKTVRICYGIEIDPRYCDVIVNRWIKWMIDNDREIENIKLNGKIFDIGDFSLKTEITGKITGG